MSRLLRNDGLAVFALALATGIIIIWAVVISRVF